MAFFELTWTAGGTATVEADDLDEAQTIMTNSLTEFSAMDLEHIDVDETSVDVPESGDDD